jgi:hypothetical protein
MSADFSSTESFSSFSKYNDCGSGDALHSSTAWESFSSVEVTAFSMQSIQYTQIPQLWLRFACSLQFPLIRPNNRFAIFYPDRPIVASFRAFFSSLFLSSVIWPILGF